MERSCLGAFVLCVLALATAAVSAAEQGVPFEGFSFSIPYDGPAAGTAPAELAGPRAPADDFVVVRGDEFVLAGAGKPIRFWATNLCFGGAFPPHDVADRMARRLAALGVNCVRFHHMDNSGYPRGIWDTREAWGDFKHVALDPEALDRLDYLIAQLKKNGVYADLNLHVSRNFSEQDGFPKVGHGEAVPAYGKGMDQFYPLAISEQKRYAQMLLRHVNAYTGKPYAEEPAVAIVEISNEDGLILEWRDGGLDRSPKPYQDELGRQWNAWVRAHYADTAALRAAWGQGESAGGGASLLAAIAPSLQTVEPARATMTPATGPDGRPAWRIQVQQASPTSWHVQLHWTPVAVSKGVTYSLTVGLRADRVDEVAVGCMMDHEPWGPLGLRQNVQVGPKWTEHTFLFKATQDDAPANGQGGARITIGELSKQGLAVEVTRPVLVRAAVAGLAPGEGIEQGIGLPSRATLGGRTAAVETDFIRFLRDTEAAYWKGMCDYLHKELGVKAQVTGTAVGYTTSDIAAETVDFVDSHAYWQHPNFPGRPWDAENWVIRGTPMVNEPAGSTIVGLAGHRVFGLPYTVTEYNEPAPHPYAAEAFPLLAAYGSFQGWSGLFEFAYAGGNDWEVDHLDSFFDMKGDPVKLALMPACADLLRNRRVGPAGQAAAGRMDADARLATLLASGPGGFNAYTGGVGPQDWQKERVGVEAGRGAPATAAETGGALDWTVSPSGQGCVRYVGAAATGLIGFANGQTVGAGGIEIAPGATSLSGFSVVMLNAVGGRKLGEKGRYLLTAVTRCANPGMVWNAAGTSVGSKWGAGPSLCEGVPVRLTVPQAGAGVHVFALKPDGTRGEEAAPGAGGAFDLGPRYRTLWYELVIGD